MKILIERRCWSGYNPQSFSDKKHLIPDISNDQTIDCKRVLLLSESY